MMLNSYFIILSNVIACILCYSSSLYAVKELLGPYAERSSGLGSQCASGKPKESLSLTPSDSHSEAFPLNVTDPILNYHKVMSTLLFGENNTVKESEDKDSVNLLSVSSPPLEADDDPLAQYPSGNVMRAELFYNKPSVHLPISELMQQGHCNLKQTNDYMQTALDAFAIFLYGNLEDILRLPADYVLRSARTIAMMTIAKEKLAATWTIVKGSSLTEEVTFETLQMYRPLFKYLNGREMARLNLNDSRILMFIGTHPDLDRHQTQMLLETGWNENPELSTPLPPITQSSCDHSAPLPPSNRRSANAIRIIYSLRKQENMSCTTEQLNAMFDFLDDHKDLARGHLRSADGRLRAKRLWQDLTTLLNSLGGSVKTTQQWQKVGVVASKYIKTNPNWLQPNYLNQMNNLLCGVPMIFMRRIPENIYLQLTHQIFYHIKACDPLQRRFYLAMMTRTQALGKSYSWSARDVSRLGLLLSEVEGSELAAVNPEAMSGLTAQVMLEISPTSLQHITEMQLRYIGQKPLNILAKRLRLYQDQLRIYSKAISAIPVSFTIVFVSECVLHLLKYF